MPDNAGTLDECIDCVAWVQMIGPESVGDIKQIFKQIQVMGVVAEPEFKRLCSHIPGLAARLCAQSLSTPAEYREAVASGYVNAESLIADFETSYEAWVVSAGWAKAKKHRADMGEISKASGELADEFSHIAQQFSRKIISMLSWFKVRPE